MDPWYYVLASATLLNAIPSFIYAIQSARQAGDDHGRQIVALYAAARSGALVVLAVVPFFGRFDGWLLAIAVAMILVQGLDAFIGIRRRQIGMIAGPAVLAVLNLVAPRAPRRASSLSSTLSTNRPRVPHCPAASSRGQNCPSMRPRSALKREPVTQTEQRCDAVYASGTVDVQSKPLTA